MPDASVSRLAACGVRRAEVSGISNRAGALIGSRDIERDSQCLTPHSQGIGVRHRLVRGEHRLDRQRRGADEEIPDTSVSRLAACGERRAEVSGISNRAGELIGSRDIERDSQCLTPCSQGIRVRHRLVRGEHRLDRQRRGADEEMPDTSVSRLAACGVRRAASGGVWHLESRRGTDRQPRHRPRFAMPDAAFAGDRRQASPRPRRTSPRSPASWRGRGDARHLGQSSRCVAPMRPALIEPTPNNSATGSPSSSTSSASM